MRCQDKTRYETYSRAKARAKRLRNAKDVRVSPYWDARCRAFFIGHRPKKGRNP